MSSTLFPLSSTSPWADPELVLYRDQIRKVFENEFAPDEEKWRAQHRADREVWNRAGKFGLLCASIPEEYGGGGGSFLHEAVVGSEMARAMVSSFSINVHSGILAHYILNYGSEAQRQRWLPKMATGELVAAIAMTEPGAGSDLQSIRTTAVRKDGYYLINGAKTFITNGYHADLVCVAVKTDPNARAKGVSLIMVETKDLEGFRRGKLIEKIGQRGQDTAELFFDNVKVPVANLLGEGEEGLGFEQLMRELPRERMLIAVGALAIAQRAVEEAVAYTKDRQVFGKSLLSLQNTRFKLAECKTQVAVAQAFIDDCSARLMRGELDAETAAMAKLWMTETNSRVIDECLQLYGGYGYTTEYPIGRMYADARVSRIYGGSSEIMKEIIARTLDR